MPDIEEFCRNVVSDLPFFVMKNTLIYVYCKELTHVITEAANPPTHICHLQAADPIKQVVEIPVWVQSLGTRNTDGLGLSSRAREDQCLNSDRKKERSQRSASIQLSSIWPLNGLDWMTPIHNGAGHPLYSSNSHASLPETSSQTHPERTFNQVSGRLMAQLSWHKINHHADIL